MSANALPSISTTGSSTVARVTPNAGCGPCGVVRVARCRRAGSSPLGVGGGAAGVRRPRARFDLEEVRGADAHPAGGERANSGPAMTVGIAITTPSARVMPRSAFRSSIATSGPGVRRHEAVHHGESGQRGDRDPDQRQAGAPGDQEDDRHQQDEPDLEEHRQADQRADRAIVHGSVRGAGPADDRVHDLVGAAGVGEQLAEHRAERDQRADAGRGVPKPVVKLRWRRRSAGPATPPTASEPRVRPGTGAP